MEINNKENILTIWLYWHFYEMPKFLFEVWKNYISFASNFFSLEILLKSLFSPWHKYKWSYPKGLDISEFFSTLISNTFSRIIGFFMRIVLILISIPFQIFIILAGLVIILAWLFIPLIIVAGFLFVLLY
jgi:hypothetical protein